MLTDSHTHIYYTADMDEQARQVERCLQNHIGRLFLPNVDLESIGPIDAFTEKYAGMAFKMLGLHPCSVQADFEDVLQQMFKGRHLTDYCAIGEIGLDLHWDKTTLGWQQQAFAKQCLIAAQADLPIVIHCREAFNELFESLDDLYAPVRGILHCFTGTADQARRAIGYGLYLGIGGVVTYKNSGLDKVLADVPLERVVLETDAPYLAPVPYRGKQNESSYLKIIAAKVADIYGIGLDRVAEVTTGNSRKVFGI